LTTLENVSKDVVISDTPTLSELNINAQDVDWVSYGAVSSVKNQGSCSASYAFSAIGAVEAASFIFYKTTNEYSVQQVIDCSQSYGNNGCVNGRMDFTFNYIKDRGKSGII
jgi:cathepsin L